MLGLSATRCCPVYLTQCLRLQEEITSMSQNESPVTTTTPRLKEIQSLLARERLQQGTGWVVLFPEVWLHIRTLSEGSDARFHTTQRHTEQAAKLRVGRLGKR